ncbi:MAG: hypothetical protein H7Z37_03920 [Pyrinomonadaceae bacterium]|nr:hypothetical protein [Pyrinomonadaceae bacterium]
MPRSLDVDEFRRDVELFNALQPVVLAVTKLAELIDDTTMLVAHSADNVKTKSLFRPARQLICSMAR